MKRKRTKSTKRKDAQPLSLSQEKTRDRALGVLALSRRSKLSLREAAKIERILPSTVLRYAGSAFEKRGKDYHAKKSDRISRPLTVLDSKGPRPLKVSSSRAARRISQYWNALAKAKRTKSYAALNKFRGERVPNTKFNFIVSPAKLKKFADAGILKFEKLYWTGKAK
jgi:hypothetical protein